MRDILFRGKRKDNGEWVEGSYVQTFNEDKTCPVVGVMKENHWIAEKNGNIVLVDKDTICQYTGLTDKNGNKIWENDIVRGNMNGYKGVFVINWNDIECRFGFPTIARVKGNDYEVIGNTTFDNFDLLKGE